MDGEDDVDDDGVDDDKDDDDYDNDDDYDHGSVDDNDDHSDDGDAGERFLNTRIVVTRRPAHRHFSKYVVYQPLVSNKNPKRSMPV